MKKRRLAVTLFIIPLSFYSSLNISKSSKTPKRRSNSILLSTDHKSQTLWFFFFISISLPWLPKQRLLKTSSLCTDLLPSSASSSVRIFSFSHTQFLCNFSLLFPLIWCCCCSSSSSYRLRCEQVRIESEFQIHFWKSPILWNWLVFLFVWV